MMKALRGPLRKRESHLWVRDEHDWYVEPTWCSGRLFEAEEFPGGIWDPACGIGNIVAAAGKAVVAAIGSDKIKRRRHFLKMDFLLCGATSASDIVSNIVSNPPFSVAEEFVKIALNLATNKVAMLLPANWVQGDKRSRWLKTTPLRRVYFLTPRPSMPPGKVVEAGLKPGNGTTDYAWFVWEQGYRGPPEIGWLHRDAT